MLKKGEKVKIQRGNDTVEVEIIGVVNITVDSRWYTFDINLSTDSEEAPANYRIEENYIGKTTNNAGETRICQVCKHLYVSNNDEIIATKNIVIYV